MNCFQKKLCVVKLYNLSKCIFNLITFLNLDCFCLSYHTLLYFQRTFLLFFRPQSDFKLLIAWSVFLFLYISEIWGGLPHRFRIPPI